MLLVPLFSELQEMVGVPEEDAIVGKKRESEDSAVGVAGQEGVKKARMEETEMTRRIKKYLEENRSQKFIDVDKMSASLHATYPDYGRKKQAVFKVQVT